MFSFFPRFITLPTFVLNVCYLLGELVRWGPHLHTLKIFGYGMRTRFIMAAIRGVIRISMVFSFSFSF